MKHRGDGKIIRTDEEREKDVKKALYILESEYDRLRQKNDTQKNSITSLRKAERWKNKRINELEKDNKRLREIINDELELHEEVVRKGD